MQSCCHAIRKYPSFCGEITTNVRFITSQKNLDLTEIVSKAELGERERVRNEERTEKIRGMRGGYG